MMDVVGWPKHYFKTLFNRAYFPVWLAFFGVAISLVYAELQNRTIHLQKARASVQNEAGLIRSRLEGYLNADLQLVSGLVAVVSSNPAIDQAEFSDIAARAIGDKSEILNVAVAPDLVVRMVHPLGANRAVLGLDYNKNEAQRAAALRVRDSGEVVLAGPVALLQGGTGFIGRFPIFTRQGGSELFWGIASVVLDAETIFAATGVTDPNSGLEIALTGRDGMGAKGGLFFGDPGILTKKPVQMDIALPAGTWQLAAIPKGGWPTQSDNPWSLRLILLGAGVLIMVPTFLACHLSAVRRGVITTLSKRERELEEHQDELQRLSAVAENATDSIVLTDADARIIWVNEAFSAMTGYSRGEALGCTPGELLNGHGTDPLVLDQILAHRARGEPFRTEILNYTKAGDEIWVDTRLVPVLDDAGKVSMVIGVERDMTQAKRHELELAEAKHAAEQADRAKSEFLANMSHEIRTPMNGIIGMAEILSEAPLAEKDRQCLDAIRSSSSALLTIINDILDLSRLEAGKLTISEVNFDIAACVDAVVEVLRPDAIAKGLRIGATYDPDLPSTVRADDGRLRQILLNLAGNAVKFTQRGQVCLHVRCRAEDRYRLIISVKDTGIGLSATEVAQIFDRFSQADAAITRSYGGTGLGLTISRRLADLMGGDITVQSTPGEGSCFCVEIQMKPPLQAEELPQPIAAPDLRIIQGRRILVAEDNCTNRLLIRKYLSDHSVELFEAENGRVAIEKCAKHGPDIVLMDMSMPEMDGITAAKAIRARSGPQPMIIALTANAFSSDRAACLAAGMNAFLTKPVKKAQLLEAMASILQNNSDKTGSNSIGLNRALI